MEENNNGVYEKRIKEIDERIVELKAHLEAWNKAGAPGRMKMQAFSEIKELEAEKVRIKNNTQDEYIRISNKIEELKKLRAQCQFLRLIKKKKLEKEINYYEQEKIKLH